MSAGGESVEAGGGRRAGAGCALASVALLVAESIAVMREACSDVTFSSKQPYIEQARLNWYMLASTSSLSPSNSKSSKTPEPPRTAGPLKVSGVTSWLITDLNLLYMIV